MLNGRLGLVQVAVELEGLVYVDGSSPLPGSSLWVGGDLRLRQLTPVSYKETVETYKASVLDTSAPQIEDVQYAPTRWVWALERG